MPEKAYLYKIAAIESRGVEITNPFITATASRVLEAIALFPPSPNPSYGACTIHFQTPQSCRAQLGLYSITGQFVETIFDKVVEQGIHAIHWSGHAIPAGTYLLCLETNYGNESQKITILR